MSKQDVQDAIKDLNRKRDENLEKLDSLTKVYNDMDDDVFMAKRQDEKFLTDSKYVPKDIEEIYEERRKLYFDFLDKSDEAKAELKNKKEKLMKEYDEELERLNKELKEYDEDKDEDSDEENNSEEKED